MTKYNISVIGTGMVGQTIADKMLDLGHTVTMGTRDTAETRNRTEPHQVTGVVFSDWLSAHPDISLVNYEDTAADADLIINATKGDGALPALGAVGKENLSGKTVLDISNPLDFSKGMPPTLSVCNTDSLGEQIQRTFPEANIVKSLNTMNAYLMVNPDLVPGDHNVFISGNDENAKNKVRELLASVGWQNSNIIDLGDISTARGTEMLLPIWLQLWNTLGTPEFNFHIARK